jgi:hypothetical protein
MTAAEGKWPAYARLTAVAPAGDSVQPLHLLPHLGAGPSEPFSDDSWGYGAGRETSLTRSFPVCLYSGDVLTRRAHVRLYSGKLRSIRCTVL